jgi:hypothetical protein
VPPQPGYRRPTPVLRVPTRARARGYLEVRFEAELSVEVKLPPRLKLLLLALARVANEDSCGFRRPASRGQIAEIYRELRGAVDAIDDDVVTKYVYILRSQIKKTIAQHGSDLEVPDLIETVQDVGYRLGECGMEAQLI